MKRQRGLNWFFASRFRPIVQIARECQFEVVVAARVGADEQLKPK
jgi:hypothetical protein